MPKITFLGAGSTIFAKNLLTDILSFPELANSTIALHDIDPARLQTSEMVARQMAEKLNAHPTIEASLDRRQSLDSADYAISMYQIGGYKPSTVIDFEIPKKYGLRQTIADTHGIGGIMRGLRTIPVMLDICRDMEELCPDVIHLNYVNPMAMNCWAVLRATNIQTVGLCHSVQGTANQLANDIGIPVEEIDYLCAGINHMAFYLRFEHNGQDLYPRLHQVIEDGRIPHWNRVRYEMLKRLGCFVTESSEHFSEYVPWFIKRDRPDLIEQYNIPLDEYPRRCEAQIAMWQVISEELAQGHFDHPLLSAERSHEYGAYIIHSLETGTHRTFYGNVLNHNVIDNHTLIDNLPQGCCVEVPCHVNDTGIHPQPIGKLPPLLAALMQTNINVQALTVEAALTGRRDHIYHAAMLDPHTSAELDLDQIWHLVDDLIEAHGDWLPGFG
jgi:alpha-galactosidase